MTFPEHCTSYSAANISLISPRKIKNRICRQCKKNAALLTSCSGARHLKLVNYLTPTDEIQIEKILETITPKNYRKFKFLDVEVSKAAIYECFLLFKKMSDHFSYDEWKYFRVYLRNSLQSLVGFSKIFAQEKPDLVFFYSPQYGVNGVCAEYAAKQGAKTYFVEGSSSNSERYEALRIWDWAGFGLVNPALQHWASFRNNLYPEDILRVNGHFQELFKARSYAVYSEPITKEIDLRKQFKIPEKAKIALATLSSFDEAYAAYVIGKFPRRKVMSPVYKDQFEWIRDSISWFGGRENIYLIIRVHPRDFPNKRDSQKSEQVIVWEKLFVDLPKNICVNWPKDGISLYNMLDQVDVVLTGWSATGVEALMFGVPVVTYDSYLPSFPSDIHFSGETKKEFFANIDRALLSEHGFPVAERALRWLAVNFSLGTVRVKPLMRKYPSPWKNILLPGFLKRSLNKMALEHAKRCEARAGFQSQIEADRFIELCIKQHSSLFETLHNKKNQEQEKIVSEVLREEFVRFQNMIKYIKTKPLEAHD